MNEKRKQRGAEKDEVIFPLPISDSFLPVGYTSFIENIKKQILKTRLQTTLSANVAMITLYWNIGNEILERQLNEGWGAKVIDRMSYDLKRDFPQMNGFSPRNLKYMRKFAEAWTDFEFVQRTVAQIPWRSNITLLDKLQDPQLRLWYAQKTIELGLGKDMLVFQIESKLHIRQGSNLNNFDAALSPLDSDLTKQIFKDPYLFDFLGTDDPRREYELEQKLIDHIQKFLIELGQGFAFVGRQVHLELGGDDFYVDLLFYHLKLRCFVVVDLKNGDFKPEYISKMNMYLNVVNDTMRHQDDKMSIGLLLVKSKNKLVVEYALSGFTNPIGVSNWTNDIKTALPDDLKDNLPSIEELENEIKQQFEE